MMRNAKFGIHARSERFNEKFSSIKNSGVVEYYKTEDTSKQNKTYYTVDANTKVAAAVASPESNPKSEGYYEAIGQNASGGIAGYAAGAISGSVKMRIFFASGT